MALPNNYTGDTPLVWPGSSYTLRYDWRALAAIQTAFEGKIDEHVGPALGDPLSHVDDFLTIVVAGLAKHHPEMTREAIEEMSPPVGITRDAVVAAINRASYGGNPPPVETPDNPPTAVA